MDNSENKDIRWKQRFVNFNKAFLQFERFLKMEELNELENQGLIKAFEYTFELAWKTLQDLLKEKGYKLELGDIIDLKILLDDLSLPYKFDLVNYDRISEVALLDHINRVGIKLF